jgi:hypothetical protein
MFPTPDAAPVPPFENVTDPNKFMPPAEGWKPSPSVSLTASEEMERITRDASLTLEQRMDNLVKLALSHNGSNEARIRILEKAVLGLQGQTLEVAKLSKQSFEMIGHLANSKASKFDIPKEQPFWHGVLLHALTGLFAGATFATVLYLLR